MSPSPQYDAYASDQNTALLCTLTFQGRAVKFAAGDTCDVKLYQPDGKTFIAAMEIVNKSPLLVRYRFTTGQLLAGQWRFRPYLVWTSANWEGYAQMGFFTVGPD